MAISRRLRFEILRRDNHTCRYCGAVAPDVALTVDHVVPVSLGGSDDPSNLVAACRPCNSGKASASLSDEQVADIRLDALRWSRAMRAAVMERGEEIEVKNDYLDAFQEAWNQWKRAGEPIRLPSGWRHSVDKWRQLGVSETILIDAIWDAMSFGRYRGNESDREFRFMAGIVWRTVEELNLRTLSKLEGHPDGPYDIYEAYSKGWDAGYLQREREGLTPAERAAINQAQELSGAVDGDVESKPVF